MEERQLTTSQWIEQNKDLCFELLRFYLGIALFLKGLHFLFDQSVAVHFLKVAEFDFFPYLFAHAIMLAHIAGGLFLAVGLLTRIAAAIQIPILFGAVFLVHLKEGLFTKAQTLEFTMLVLVLLVVYAIYGGGRLSVDHAVAKRSAKQHGEG